MRAEYVKTMLARYGDMAVDKEENKKNIRTTPFADSLPPYERILVSPDKLLWVVDGMSNHDSGWSATAFRHDGAMVARLRVADKSWPVAFNGDHVLVRAEDADGNVVLRVHRLQFR